MWSRAVAKEIVVGGLGPAPVKFRATFLRDACSENGAVDPNSRQKTFSTPQIAKTTIADASIVNDSLNIKWSDNHESSLSRDWLQRYASLESSLKYRTPQKWVPWDLNAGKFLLPTLGLDDLMAQNSAYKTAMNQLGSIGILQIQNIPPGEFLPLTNETQTDRPTVETIACKIGNYVKNTFYGPSWNVRSIQQARNIAYTSVFLPLHMDLLYYESPPGIQLLHVVENSCTGGESYFSDAYAAALHLQETDPDAYNALATVPISYHYVNDGQHYFQMRPVIVENMQGIDHLNYSPPFQGPLDALNWLDDKTADDFMRGLAAFEAYVEAKENQVQFRMDPGTCVIFYNRRILHARREFDASSGTRFFKGAYTDIDAFNSTLRTLA